MVSVNPVINSAISLLLCSINGSNAASTPLLPVSTDICYSYAAEQYYIATRRSFLLNDSFGKITAELVASVTKFRNKTAIIAHE
jgi:hypothetical protein